MSIRAMLYVQQIKGISLIERGILAKLADHANKDGGGVYLSLATIATHAQMTPRHVQRILAKLLEAGRIEVTGDNARNGGRRPTTYRVIIPDGFDIKTGKNCSESDTSGVTPVSPLKGSRGDSSVTPGVTPVSPEPVLLNRVVSLRFAQARAEARPGVRDELWQDGVPLLRALTGKPDGAARALLGKLLRDARDDCARVLAALREAADARPIDPVPWLTEAVKERRNSANDIGRLWDLPTFGSENQF